MRRPQSVGVHPEDWYPEEDLDALYRAAAVAPIQGASVEVGSFTGQSATMLCQVRPVLMCVDPWGDMAYADRPDIAAGVSHSRFVENTAGLAVVRFRCGWREFFDVFDGPLAFLHIDAVHEYDHVRDNILAALPYLVPGGVLCGHDHWDMFPGVERAVRDTLGTYSVEAKVWSWVNQ